MENFAQYRAGQGHLNIDITVFQNNPTLFRNFLVYYANRPELAYGILGNHMGNSPPLASLDASSKEAFAALIKKFDSEPISASSLASQMSRNVYTSHPTWPELSIDYYQAIRFLSNRIEIRAFRPQESTTEYLTELLYLEMLINHLAKSDKLIEVDLPSSHKVDPQTAVDNFYRDITEMGGDWNVFKTLLPKVEPADYTKYTPTVLQKSNSVKSKVKSIFGK